LGNYQAQAGQAVRLVRFRVGALTVTSLTNVLDPTVLSIQEIARLYARRWDIEIVQPQMTKTHLFTVAGGGDHIADLHLFVGHDDSVDQQLHELPLLLK